MVYILGAKRTAIGRFMKTFQEYSASQLGAVCAQAVLQQTKVPTGDVQDVIIGQVLTAGQGQNPARKTAMQAGIPETTPALTINHVCGSGLRSVVLGYQSILAGLDCVMAGGQESMSNAHFSAYYDRKAPEKDSAILKDTMLTDGLTCAFDGTHMGVFSEKLAQHYNISRAEQDAFALASHQKAQHATESGYFKDEITPAFGVDTDQHIRFNMTLGDIADLNPAFDRDNGTVTAGNASGVNDGAAMVLLGSDDYVKRHAITPMAKIVSYGLSGVSPDMFGIGPVTAVKNALNGAGWALDDLDLIESNEAFAVQSMAVNKELGWNTDKVNINGGAVALGHPIGASGTRVLTTLLYNLKRTGGKRGIATLCIGGGQGIALCVECA